MNQINQYLILRNIALNKLDHKPSPDNRWFLNNVIWSFKWSRITLEEFQDITNIYLAYCDSRYIYDRDNKVLIDTASGEVVNVATN